MNDVGGAADPPLTGRTVLIAGSPLPLLTAIARAARELGAHVALATTRSTADAIVEGVTRFPFVGESEPDADVLFDGLTAPFDRLDIMIVAVPSRPLETLHDLSLEGWDAAVIRPLRQLFWMVRRVIEERLADGGGMRIVLALQPERGLPRNDVVEEALRSFARAVAREYGRREILCTVVLPAFRSTEPAVSVRLLRHAIVEHVLFLASPAASFVNGEVLYVGLDTVSDAGDNAPFSGA